MRVLVVHESYQQRGGEDAVALAEAQQLELHGHTVLRYSRHNDELKNNGPLKIIGAGVGTMWARKSFRDLEKLLRDGRPDVSALPQYFAADFSVGLLRVRAARCSRSADAAQLSVGLSGCNFFA